MAKTFFALVTFGPSLPGPKVFDTFQEAEAHLVQCDRDTAGDGEYYSDLQSLARARILEYATLEAASAASISDGAGNVKVPGYLGAKLVRG